MHLSEQPEGGYRIVASIAALEQGSRVIESSISACMCTLHPRTSLCMLPGSFLVGVGALDGFGALAAEAERPYR